MIVRKLVTVVVSSLGIVAVVGTTPLSGSAGQGRILSASAADTAREVVDQYCVTCHNQRLKTGGLVLEGVDLVEIAHRPELWEKVVRKLRAGVMPPLGRPRPERKVQEGFVSYLEAMLDRAAAERPNPGRTETLHRLNRAEYRNTIRDLLALEVDVAELLPADDASYGFDNMAGVLKINQALMESYLTAARKISRLAIGGAVPVPGSETFRASTDLPQYARNEALPLGTRGGMLIHYNFPQDAEYEFKVKLLCPLDQQVDCDGSLAFRETHLLELTLDGERVKVFDLRPRRLNMRGPTGGIHATKSEDGEIEPLEIRIPVKAGPRDVGVTFIKTMPDREIVRGGFRKRLSRPFRYYADAMAMVQPFVERVTINGPFNVVGAGDTPSRRAILTCRPTTAAEEAACAQSILARLARRAHRRPVTAAEVQDLFSFYAEARADGESFEAGVEAGIRVMLVVPAFLFRVEEDPDVVDATGNYRLEDLDLASRLSFFLWSSIPDEELLSLAERGRLSEPAVLDQQVRRLLADPRSSAIVDNFAGQWLKLRNTVTVRPSEPLFPDFEEELRQSMRRETELFFESIMREDRSIMELLTANYSFLNERLALHYDVPGVRGSEFRRVEFPPDNPRRGLLGQASILAVTSQPNRTSPVIRGKWVMENVLGISPPPPPGDVPGLEEPDNPEKRSDMGMRERMAAHSANPVCSSCHSVIDPIGFSLENFDAVGRLRDVDEALRPIDASGVLPDGTKFDGFAAFQRALASQPERFVTVFTERMLTYALGRGLDFYDQPAVRTVVHGAARDDYRFASIVLGIVRSLPFQMRRAEEQETRSAL